MRKAGGLFPLGNFPSPLPGRELGEQERETGRAVTDRGIFKAPGFSSVADSWPQSSSSPRWYLQQDGDAKETVKKRVKETVNS